MYYNNLNNLIFMNNFRTLFFVADAQFLQISVLVAQRQMYLWKIYDLNLKYGIKLAKKNIQQIHNCLMEHTKVTTKQGISQPWIVLFQ